MKGFCEKHHIYYGWVMVFAAMLCVGCSWGVVNNCYPLTVTPMTELYGYSRSAYAVNQTIRMAVYALAAAFSGRIFKKIRPIVLLRISGIILPATWFLFGHCSQVWQLYILAVLSGLGMVFLAFPIFTVIISNWFEARRGTAIGIAFMGSGLGGMVFNALSGIWIEKMGIVSCFHVQAICVAVLCIPCVFLILKEKPEDMGMEPLREKSKEGSVIIPPYGFTFREGLKKTNFWLIVLAAACIGFVANVSSMNYVPHITDLGYEKSYAANLNAVYLGIVCVTKILAGLMYDKFHAKPLTIFLSLMLIPSMFCMVFSQYQILHILIIVFMAIGNTTSTVTYPHLVVISCGTMDYVMICGILNAAASVGSSVAPIISNVLYDTTGSYISAFWVGIFVIAVAILAVFLVRPLKKPEAVHS